MDEVNMGNKQRAISSVSRLILVFLTITFACLCDGSIQCLEHFNCQMQDEKKIVSCTDSGIDVVPLCLNPKLFRLSLHNTMIPTLYVTSLRFYGDLKYLNLNDNKINKIQNKTFAFQKGLQELHLGGNKISHLDSETFFGLRDLTVLSLRKNLIENIPSSVFKRLSQLVDLDMSQNRIMFIDEQAFQGLPKLTVLLLSSNRLSVMPTSSFTFVPHLAELSIGENHIPTLDKRDFFPLSALTSLDLSGANFANGLNPEAFFSVKDLKKLFLNDCSMTYVPRAALEVLAHLQLLSLDRNQFVDISRNAFFSNKKLQTLSISGCPKLERISDGSLEANIDLEVLDLSRNVRLSYLPHKDFLFLSSLSSLDLHGNQLEYIPEDVVRWDDIADWKIHDNPFACNCSAAWLRKLLIDRNHSSSVTCNSPKKLKGKHISSLDLIDLSCGMSSSTRDLVIALPICLVILLLGCFGFYVVYQNRTSCVRRLLKRHKLGRTRNSHRSCDSEYPCIKPIPVTEL